MTTFFRSLLLVTLAFAPLAQADSQFKFVELAYADQNPDFQDFDNEDATVFIGNFELHKYLFASIRYQDGSAPLPVPQETDEWYSYGIGAKRELATNFWGYLSLERNVLKGDGADKEEKGMQKNIGFRYTPGKWRLGLELGVINVFNDEKARNGDSLDDEIIATYEAGYNVWEGLVLMLRIRDTGDLDMTSYEVGLRWEY